MGVSERGEARIPSPSGGYQQKVSVERLELSTNGLKGQHVKNAFGNQGLIVLSQSIRRVERKSIGCLR
jgi:hypothetical protein